MVSFILKLWILDIFNFQLKRLGMKFTLCDLYKATAPNKRRSRRSFWLRQIEKSKKPIGQKKKSK